MRQLAFLWAILLCCAHALSAQTVTPELERITLGFYGGWGTTGGAAVDYHAGELVTTTSSAAGTDFTKGLLQPLIRNQITVAVNTTPSTCQSNNNGSLTLTSLSGCTGNYQILWNTGDTTATLTGLAPGVYSVSISDAFCEFSQSYEVLEGENRCPLEFYTGVSPNGDGVNDRWIIGNITLPYYANNEVAVFNRWGQEVYRVSGYNNASAAFTGTTNGGKPLPTGTYFYSVMAGGEEYTGYIELIP